MTYLEIKRRAVPRLNFVSQDVLLHMCSVGREPRKVMQHINSFTDSTKGVHWQPADESGAETSIAIGCRSGDGEDFFYAEPSLCTGALDDWLPGWLEHQVRQMHTAMKVSLEEWGTKTREGRLEQLEQLCLSSNHMVWTVETNAALERRQQGASDAVARHLESLIGQISFYGAHVRKSLPKLIRKRVNTLVTVLAHQRDVVATLDHGNATADSFDWTSQFRAVWDVDRDNCLILQGSCEVAHKHEYIGCSGRLAVTALTDRCYLTISTALKLAQGVFPMGPAGSGKTETVKDFAKNVGAWAIVLNCSDQMDAHTLKDVVHGIAQTGSYCIFDEFNRISLAALATTYDLLRPVMDAIRAGRTSIAVGDEHLHVHHGGLFAATMNPGYLGRNELPENLKQLFRPVMMCVAGSRSHHPCLAAALPRSLAAALPRSLAAVLPLRFAAIARSVAHTEG